MANKIITMCHYARPEYSRRALEALAKCDGIEEYRVLAHVDRCPDSDILALVGQVLASAAIPNLWITTYPSRVGVNVNTAWALAHAFEDGGAEFVIHVEDDILLAPDALRFFEHCAVAYRDDPAVFSVTAYNRLQVCPDPDRWHDLQRREWYHGWGWGIWRDRWAECDVAQAPGTWDVHIHRNVMHRPRRRVEIHPTLSRSQNIGARSSLHTFSEEWHAENHHVKHWAGDRHVPVGAWNERRIASD